jgi:uncharacterized protein (DUF2147 family)
MRILRIIPVAVFVFVSTVTVLADTLQVDDFKGVWLTANKQAKMEIYQKRDKTYAARLVWVDERAADADAQQVGKDQITGLKHRKGLVLKDGRGYVPKADAHLRFTLTLVSEDRLEVKVKKGLLGKTKVWTRAK